MKDRTKQVGAWLQIKIQINFCQLTYSNSVSYLTKYHFHMVVLLIYYVKHCVLCSLYLPVFVLRLKGTYRSVLASWQYVFRWRAINLLQLGPLLFLFTIF